MQHVVHALAGPEAGFRIADVPADEAKVFPLAGRGQFFHHVEVVLVPGHEVVEPHYPLPVRQQRLQQIGPDEARYARDEPCAGMRFEMLKKLMVTGHGRLREKRFCKKGKGKV